MTVPLRKELSGLATTYPGLQNDRVRDLVSSTGRIEDRDLVRDIRKLAAETAGLGGGQQTEAVNGKAEVLESRLRLGAGAHAPTPEQTADVQGDRLRASPGQGASGPSAGRASPNAAQSPPPGVGAGPTTQRASTGPNIFDRILNAVSGADDALNQKIKEAWDRAPTPMATRHADFREAFQGQREEKVLKAAEVAGAAAIEAMRVFSNGPGNHVMARIHEAAKSDPEGLKGVLSEMRAGGKYEGLRQQLQGEQALTKGFAESFERAAAAVGAYGRQRGAVDEIAVQRGNIDQVASRFEKLDAEVGQRAAALPAPKEGRSMLDELGERVKELVVRAIDAVKAAFTPAARKDAAASASPSPNP